MLRPHRIRLPLARVLVAVAGLAVPAVLPAAVGLLMPTPAQAQLQPIPPNAPAPLPIKRIVLYRSGVGAFERRGTIDGNANIQLSFQTDQVNDILKSMFALDKGGTVESIRYGSKDPLSKRLASFGIDISDDPSAGEILKRLRGTPVKIVLADAQATGTIMNVENRPTVYPGSGQNGTVVHNLPWINLLTEQGVRSYNLTEARGFEVLDPVIAKELDKALGALAEHRADRTKTVDVSFTGAGAREAIIGYIHEMPVWKTSYRLILGDAPKAEGISRVGTIDSTMQGWAIVENNTDEDWTNVTLSLVSGRPVSFRMDLYEPLYVFRPEIPVPTVPGVMPRAYEGGLETLGATANKAMMDRDDANALRTRRAMEADGGGGGGPGRAPPAFAKVPDERTRAAGREFGVTAGEMADYAGRAAAQGVETGEVFQYQLENPVTIERQRSAMLPILTAAIPSRRVSIYNRADARKNPMRGVEITNSSSLQLIPGPISVYDGAAYAGDAQIGHVGAGDKRLLAYAVDLVVDVITEEKANTETRKIRIVDGAYEQTIKNVNTVNYTFSNKDAARDRVMIVEHPKFAGWDLVDPKAPAEKTESLYRFETTVPPGKQGTLSVTQEQITLNRVGIFDIQFDWLDQQAREGKVSKGVMDAVREVGKRRGAIADAEAKVQRLETEKNEIGQDQNRVRENMRTVGQQAQIYQTYLKKFTEQENRIEAIDAEMKTTRAEIAKLQQDLNDFVRTLNVE